MTSRYTMLFYCLLAAVFGVKKSVGLTHFCNQTRYDLDEQVCCDSKLSDSRQDGQLVQCCDASRVTYRNESEICCGSVFNRTIFEHYNLSCCNGSPYQRGMYICLGGEQIRIEGKGHGVRTGDKRIDVIERQVKKIDEVQRTLNLLTSSVAVTKDEVYKIQIICRWLNLMRSLKHHKRMTNPT